jgi:hypothetical protein
MDDLTESEVRQTGREVLKELQKIPLQTFLSVPAEPVSTLCFERKGKDARLKVSGVT